MKSCKQLNLCLFLLTLAFAADSFAAPVYKWEGPDGIIHYSSKPEDPRAKPADLPRITRGEVKLTKRELVSCKDHGGVNCQAGSDSDGSVICYDGFKGSSVRFRFSCNSPKLEIADVSEPGKDGSFSVFVRNANSVAASEPALLFKPDEGREVKLDGPKEIEAFGLAEFNFKPDPKAAIKVAKVDISKLNVTCANCP